MCCVMYSVHPVSCILSACSASLHCRDSEDEMHSIPASSDSHWCGERWEALPSSGMSTGLLRLVSMILNFNLGSETAVIIGVGLGGPWLLLTKFA